MGSGKKKVGVMVGGDAKKTRAIIYATGIKRKGYLTAIDILEYTKSMEFMTRDEVAKYLRVHARTVERWLTNKSLKGFKLGKGRTALWRIPKSEVKKFLEKHKN